MESSFSGEHALHRRKGGRERDSGGVVVGGGGKREREREREIERERFVD